MWSRSRDLHGRDVGTLAGIAASGVAVQASAEEALSVPSDVVLVATTSFLHEIASDVRVAVERGRGVITTAEEAAYPWAVDRDLADELDRAAIEQGVAILGTGINPGLLFDAFVLTLCGAAGFVRSVVVERVVDLSGFSSSVLRRIGVGHSPASFEAGRRSGRITGHIGFPQSMRLVAAALGRPIDRIDGTVTPIFSDHPLPLQNLTVAAGETGGFTQRYVAIGDGDPWFEARLVGHVDIGSVGMPVRDRIEIESDQPLSLTLEPALGAQATVAAVVANSVARVASAAPGWRTVADLPPAYPTRPIAG